MSHLLQARGAVCVTRNLLDEFDIERHLCRIAVNMMKRLKGRLTLEGLLMWQMISPLGIRPLQSIHNKSGNGTIVLGDQLRATFDPL